MSEQRLSPMSFATMMDAMKAKDPNNPLLALNDPMMSVGEPAKIPGPIQAPVDESYLTPKPVQANINAEPLPKQVSAPQAPIEPLKPTVDYEQEFNTAYQDLMGKRTKTLEGEQARYKDLEANAPSTLQKLDMQSIASGLDLIFGTNSASKVSKNTTDKDYKDEKERLKAQIIAQEGNLSDDQLNYLKMKAQEQTADKKEKSAEAKLANQLKSQEGQLRNSWLNNPLTKDSQIVASNYERIKKVANDTSPAGDLSLVFAYMKLLDPPSSVRENEQADARNAAGVPDQIRNLWNRLKTGERLNPVQRADFLGQSQNLYRGHLEQQSRFNQGFTEIALRNGYNPQNVVMENLFQIDGVNATGPQSKKVATASPEAPAVEAPQVMSPQDWLSKKRSKQ